MWVQELVDWGPSSSDFALLRALERGGCLMRKTVTSISLIVITFETLFFPFKPILSHLLLSNVGGGKTFPIYSTMWRAGLLKRHLDVFCVVQLATTTWNRLRTTPNSETNQWWNLKEINLKTPMCHKIYGRLYINSSRKSSNGILMSCSQVTRLAEVNEEPISWYLKTKWDTRLHRFRQVLNLLKTSK